MEWPSGTGFRIATLRLRLEMLGLRPIGDGQRNGRHTGTVKAKSRDFTSPTQDSNLWNYFIL
jgi:hypothetical protein